MFSILAFIMCSCNSGGSDQSAETTPATTAGDGGEKIPNPGENPSYDPDRGLGKFTNVELGSKLDEAMANEGQKISDVKCAGCHKLTDERLVGPGWKGVTERNKPEWIMNFITNPSEMIDKDPKLQAQLELCLVRMPNQSLTDDDARKLLEFMRKNDGVK